MELNLTGTQTLETERLILRRFTEGDAEAMFLNWAGDAEVTRFLLWETHADIGVSQGVIVRWLEAYADPHTYIWAIVPKETGEPIGSIGLHNLVEADCKAEAGYCIGKPWWGKGLTAEALRAVVSFGFETLGLNRVEAFHDTENPNSGCVMQKAGMLREGTLRQWKFEKGRFRDFVYYAILRDDYFKAKR